METIATEHDLREHITAHFRVLEREHPDFWWVKHVGSMFQRKGLPDIHCVSRGITLVVELKHPGIPAVPEPLQQRELTRLHNAGAVAACLNDPRAFWTLFTHTYPWLTAPSHETSVTPTPRKRGSGRSSGSRSGTPRG